MKFPVLLILFFVAVQASEGQGLGRMPKKNTSGESAIVRNYMDSLDVYRTRLYATPLDSLLGRDPWIARNHSLVVNKSAMLFTPLTFYHRPAADLLRIQPQRNAEDVVDRFLDHTLMSVYLNRPDLVRQSEKALIASSSNLDKTAPSTQQVHPNLVDIVSPRPEEPGVVPMDILVRKPNFWSFSGDQYLQLMQNYVSSNWYKGGESNYSLLGNVTLQANYNNRQKVTWDHKLELKLGLQTSRGDSIHKMSTTEDLIRYTDKLGLQATKKWYYTLQMIAYSQFTHTYKSNDPVVYAAFMSPFNLNLSLGMDYNASWLKNRLTGTVHLAPIAFNWKYVRRKELATRFGIDEGKHSLLDYGSEFTMDLTWKMSDQINWKTRLYGYTTYKRTELEWENTLVLKFSKFVSCNLFVYPRFDDGATYDEHHGYWEFKEYLSVGFSYSF